ncbi:Anoctamin-3 [Irineochytrium annulatum]|nr:Anoctamin-3 [Irineochytrium annulatum]
MSAQMRLRMRRDQLRKQRLKIISPTDEEAGEKKGIIASASEDDRAQTKVALTADDTRSDAYDYVSGASMMSSSSPTLKGATLQPFSVISLTAMSADEYVMAMDENNPHTRLPQYYRDSKLLSHPGIRDEFSQKVIQFGFLAMFICSFPLAPCFALVNNVYEIRADASKTLMVYQRPVPTRAQDIGVWEQILTFIATLSVLTNSVIISFTSPAFDRMYLASAPDEGSRMAIRLTFILTFHYVIHGLKEIIRGAFSDVPKMVSLALAREQYLERLQRDQVEEEDEIMSVHSLMSLIADDENEHLLAS